MWKTILACFEADFSRSLCKKAIMCSCVGGQGGCQMTFNLGFFSTKFCYGGRLSLKRKKKKVLKSEMCFVFYQMYHYVSGQAGMRISKEEKRTSESSSPLSTRAKDEIPPWKMSRNQIWAGMEAKGLQVGKLIPAFSLKLPRDLGSWFLFSFCPCKQKLGI